MKKLRCRCPLCDRPVGSPDRICGSCDHAIWKSNDMERPPWEGFELNFGDNKNREGANSQN